MSKKYRIIYNDERVLAITEDIGSCYLSDEHKLMTETLNVAKTMLSAIGVDITLINLYKEEN